MAIYDLDMIDEGSIRLTFTVGASNSFTVTGIDDGLKIEAEIEGRHYTASAYGCETIILNAAGFPDPTSTHNPFVDVKKTDFFYKAVLWAVEKGITNGTGAGKFSPERACNRAQVVTFMWRAEGNPAPIGKEDPFADVPAGNYYHDVVLWAVENEITNGMSATKFAPEKTCARGQIVTFLYRCFAG